MSERTLKIGGKPCRHRWGPWFEPASFNGKGEARICRKCGMQEYQKITGVIAVPINPAEEPGKHAQTPEN